VIGTHVGPYVIVAPLGDTDVGDAYRAVDTRSEREVAITLLPLSDADHEDLAHVIDEARMAAALDHPHIATVYDAGELDGRTYIATELVAGRPLDCVIPPGGLPESTVLDYCVQIADALAHAHTSGVLHRGLRTSNIIVTDAGHVKVFDFGVAVDADANHVMRTVAYTSPEQLRGRAAMPASDVWSVGVVLYEMTVGSRPFESPTRRELEAAILEHRPRPLPQSVHAILRGIISRCLAKEPSHRYRDAGELRAALEPIRATLDAPQAPSLGGSRLAVARIDAAEGTSAPRSETRWLLLGMAIAAAVIMFLATWLLG
jgi:serine/threonine-protein kinase